MLHFIFPPWAPAFSALEYFGLSPNDEDEINDDDKDDDDSKDE